MTTQKSIEIAFFPVTCICSWNDHYVWDLSLFLLGCLFIALRKCTPTEVNTQIKRLRSSWDKIKLDINEESHLVAI